MTEQLHELIDGEQVTMAEWKRRLREGPMPAPFKCRLADFYQDQKTREIQDALESSDPRKLFKVPLTTVLRPGEQPLGNC